MKKVEDAFQPLVASILAGNPVEIRDADAATVSDFYALWHMRSRRRELEAQEIELKGVLGGGGLTKDQEEKLEMNGYIFSRDGGKIPARHINGVQLQVGVFKFSRQIQASTQWGILRTNDGEFIVPDMPAHQVMPIAPQVALATGTAGGVIPFGSLVDINRALSMASQKYFFARDFKNCPR